MDISTPLCREGGLFFLPDEYFSFATDKIWERGEEEKEIHDLISIRFFFITIQSCLSWRVAGLLIFVTPKPKHDGREQVTLGYLSMFAVMNVDGHYSKLRLFKA